MYTNTVNALNTYTSTIWLWKNWWLL